MAPHRLQRHAVTVCYNHVEKVDTERHRVTIADGQEVSYWRLVIATGAGIPAIVMKRVTYVKYWFQVGGFACASIPADIMGS